MGTYLRPRSLSDALAALAAGPRAVVAGGTDIYPARATLAAWGQDFPQDLLDISALDALRGIEQQPDRIRIGAGTTWTTIADARLPAWFAGLQAAAREVGGPQIQNRGTLGGNLCNASPAADGVPPLLALDAAVQLRSAAGERTLPLDQFILGNRRTARRPDELLVAVIVPTPRHEARSTFLKLGARRYLVISIVMASAAIEIEAGRVAAARIAIGACAPTAMRLPALEAALRGQPLGAGLAAVPQDAHLGPLSPIDDVRGTGSYRRAAALTLVRRALADLAMPQAASHGAAA